MNYKQEDFWSNNPCGVDGDFNSIAKHRYQMEPFLTTHLKSMALKFKNKSKILEVGCGQGTDALYICSKLSKNHEYIAIDFSSESIRIANRNKTNFFKKNTTNCLPKFEVGDALDLRFNDEEFDFVYSMGVIHHTPDMLKAINEIFRILKKDGKATIYLYRTGSLKVEVAKFLRKFQKLLDFLLRKERSIYLLFRNIKSKYFGTMFLECFGVPILRSVNKFEIENLFSKFSKINYLPCGNNIPFYTNSNRFGYFYKIDLIK